jgi:pSer/pThr/pTyr-binding forkhead associated (FHA) protein
VEVTRELRGVRLRGLVDRLISGSGPRTLGAPEIGVGEARSLGRATSCDYVIHDPTVSNRHAELVRVDDGGWLIRDLGSRNGTRVNGWLVKEQRLRDGDTLTLGESVFLFDAS